MIVVVVVVMIVIFVVPVALVQLPALLIMVVVRVIPVRAFIRRMVPTSGNPPVVVSVRRPVTIDPGIARTWRDTALFVADRRRAGAYLQRYLRGGRNGKSGGKQCATYPIELHSLGLPVKSDLKCRLRNTGVFPHRSHSAESF